MQSRSFASIFTFCWRSNEFFQLMIQYFNYNASSITFHDLHEVWCEEENGKVMTSVIVSDCIFCRNEFVYLVQYILWRQSRVSQSLDRQSNESQMAVLESETRVHPLPFLRYFL